MNYKKVHGRIMVISGFLMLIFNALDYLLGWNQEIMFFGIIGLVFVVIGLNWIKKGNE